MSTCPACDNPFQEGPTVRDHSVSQDEFKLLTCPSCGLMKTIFPEGKDIAPYYESAAYISHTARAKGLIQRLYLLVRKHTLNRKFQLLESLRPPSRSVADIGCGTGDFLERMKRGGWEISGVEPSDHARAIAEQRTGSTIGKELRAFHATVGMITLWHVLEHLNDPSASIRKLSDNLQEGGTLLIAVPNYKSADAEFYGNNWAGLDVPRHLWHFTRSSINQLAIKNGMRVTTVLPMKFDSFYVSMMSEGYKAGKKSVIKDLLKGSWQGLCSNWHARKSGEYSSLIYILTK